MSSIRHNQKRMPVDIRNVFQNCFLFKFKFLCMIIKKEKYLLAWLELEPDKRQICFLGMQRCIIGSTSLAASMHIVHNASAWADKVAIPDASGRCLSTVFNCALAWCFHLSPMDTAPCAHLVCLSKSVSVFSWIYNLIIGTSQRFPYQPSLFNALRSIKQQSSAVSCILSWAAVGGCCWLPDPSGFRWNTGNKQPKDGSLVIREKCYLTQL